MTDFLGETWFWVLALVNHVFGMMYWMWLPGFALSGLLFARYHRPLRIRLAKTRRVTSSSLWLALSAGTTGSSNRGTIQRDLKAILLKGVPLSLALVSLIGGLNLVLYALSFLTLNLGIEFFLGQVIGALVMAGAAATLAFLLPEESRAGVPEESNPALAETIVIARQEVSRGQPLAKGLVRYFGREWRGIWLSALLGLFLAGVIATLGQRDWWPDFERLMGGGARAEVGNAFLGALLGVFFFASPIGHLFIASLLWKTYTLTFGGILAFILSSAVSPQALWGYCQTFGRGPGLRAGGLLYLSSALGALAVVGLFQLVGFEVTHTPLFHEFVNEVMMFFSIFGGRM